MHKCAGSIGKHGSITLRRRTKKRPKPQGWGERAFEQGCEYARTFFSFDQQLVLPHAKIA